MPPRKRQRAPASSLLEEYRTQHIAVARGAADVRCFGFGKLREIIADHAAAVGNGWCDELSGAAMPSPAAFAATTGASPPCYTSFVVNGGPVVAAIVAALPLAAPEGFGDPKAVRHADRAWVFAGRNGVASGDAASGTVGSNGAPMAGRAEHTDQVDVAGTWHLQLRGTKKWMVRPCLGASGAPWATNEALMPPAREVLCGPGDVLVINTRTWWHATEIPVQRPIAQRATPTRVTRQRGAKAAAGDARDTDTAADADDDGLSLSVARDFVFLRAAGLNGGGGEGDEGDDDGSPPAIATNIDGVYATVALAPGDVALLERDLPGCALPRSDSPNCEVQEEIDLGGGETEAGLVAIRPIAIGECFTVAPSSDEESDENSGSNDDEEDEDEEDEEIEQEVRRVMTVPGGGWGKARR